MTETVTAEVYKRLEHIKEGCEKIIGYAAGGRDQFDRDEQVQIAIMHYISVIGEASKLHNIPKDFQVRHPEIPWREWVEQRNILVHNYDSINLNLVWRTATRDTLDLLSNISAILSSVEMMQVDKE